MDSAALFVGQTVKVSGVRGTFVVRSIGDSAITCWGGPPNRESFRSFPPTDVRPASRRRKAPVA